MFEIVTKSVNSYAEESQTNPLRWMILSKTSEKVYQQESAWLKCKDFFNDLAYTIQTGKSFTIYGFNAGTLNPPKKNKPVYMLLKGIAKGFHDNLVVVNKWLKEQKVPQIITEEYKENQFLITFDPFYFKNTYNISLISLVLRVINCDISYSSFEDIKKSTHLTNGDVSKWGAVVNKNVFFKIPKNLAKYIWYCGETINSETPGESYSIPGLVHNNGVINWSSYF